MIHNILLVGLGGAIGAMMRYGVTLLFTALHWSTNVGICLTNIIGSFCMGILVSACSQSPWLLMATVGIFFYTYLNRFNSPGYVYSYLEDELN